MSNQPRIDPFSATLKHREDSPACGGQVHVSHGSARCDDCGWQAQESIVDGWIQVVAPWREQAGKLIRLIRKARSLDDLQQKVERLQLDGLLTDPAHDPDDNCFCRNCCPSMY